MSEGIVLEDRDRVAQTASRTTAPDGSGLGLTALVSSTLFPSSAPTLDGPRSAFTPDERLAQTRDTIDSLRRHGIDRILVADNSPAAQGDAVRRALSHADVELLLSPSFPFPNRGLGEALLLLAALEQLPADAGILKISGRYRLTSTQAIADWRRHAGVFRGYGFEGRRGLVSTRCYVVRDRALLSDVLLAALGEMHVHPMRVVGPRSLVRCVRETLAPRPASVCATAIEFAMARVLHRMRLPVKVVDRIGCEGLIAGYAACPPVVE